MLKKRIKGKQIFMIQCPDKKYSNGKMNILEFTTHGKLWRGILSVKRHLRECFCTRKYKYLLPKSVKDQYMKSDLVEYKLVEVSRMPLAKIIKEVKKDLIVGTLQ